MNKTILFIFAAGLGLSTAGHADTFAITGGTVYTLGNAGKLEHATVLIRDGKIAAVGTDVKIPADAQQIDATGKIITPGIFDPESQFGIEEVELVKETRDDSVVNPHITAAFDVADAINPRSQLIPVNRIEGVTRAMVAPTNADGGSIIAGRGAIIDLGSTRGYIMRNPAALFVTFGEEGAALAGGSRAAAMLEFRAAVQDAKDYAANRASYDSGNRRPYTLSRLDLEALVPVVQGRLPVVVHVDRASDIQAVLRMASELGIKVIISGGAEAWLVADELAQAHVPVILNPLEDLPEHFESIGSTLTNAARLDKAGVLIAFASTGSHNARNLTQSAGNAVSYGLSWDAGLRAITLNPARIYGLDGDLGSLQPGKQADVVVWDGDPLEVTTFADAVFIKGKEIPMVSRQTELRDRYMQLDGDWPNGYKKP